MSLLLIWLTTQVPRVMDFFGSLPENSFITFGLCFLLSMLIGRAIGGLVNKQVAAAKKIETNNTALVAGSRSKTSRAKTAPSKQQQDSNPTSSSKTGVASPDELKDFVAKAGDRIVIIDLRNPDAKIEPGDQKSLAVAGLPDMSKSFRPKAKHLVWDRTTKSLSQDLPAEVIAKDTPIITHCGGGGRGQLAKEYLEGQGYTNVINGGGPKEAECWAVYGEF